MKNMEQTEETLQQQPGATTPLMQQYYELKRKYPDAIMLYRVGDFYETFGEDAIKTSNTLGIILSNRNNGGSQVELAGFPYHSLDLYLPKLVRAGYRVAICEQLEKPSPTKKIVRRGVTELITPGVTTDDKLLDFKSNNFLACIHTEQQRLGIALLDISTGEFSVSEGDWAYIEKLIQSYSPSEILLSKKNKRFWEEKMGDKYYAYYLEEWIFSNDFAYPKLLQHFEVQSLKGFGVEELQLGTIVAGVVLHYLQSTENTQIQHINSINRLWKEHFVWMDRFTIRNLELVQPLHENGRSLLDVMDMTVCPMGARMLRKWLLFPLLDIRKINERLHSVEILAEDSTFREEMTHFLKQMGDLERIISKIPSYKINPREMAQLMRSLKLIEPLKHLLQQKENQQFKNFGDTLNPCLNLVNTIEKTLTEEPPTLISKGNAIRQGCSELLDEYRSIISNSKEHLNQILQKEIEKTGIDNLKIGFNNVFGYYIEITNKHKSKTDLPSDWVRKQTLANAERFITDELKVLETKILSAEEKILELEEKIFLNLVGDVLDYIPSIQVNANIIAQLDVLQSFASVAKRWKYTKPQMDESYILEIEEGRHPVIEQQLPPDAPYIPNSVRLDTEQQQIILVTGPNMAGKSALLRQTALICILAQCGSFVPAQSARIGCIDKVFTRVGASDNISSGESTFMIEMNETSSILNNISQRSLLLLDEIGRGTSTYDGISIAWAITEFLHDNGFAMPKTLFATHYHELNELENNFPRIKNYHVATKEINNKVLFLRKLVPGGTEHSFGIHVAKMAGMPKSIVERANELLHLLEDKQLAKDQKGKLKKISPKLPPMQLNIFDATDPRLIKVGELLHQLDLNGMTPIDCLMKLHEFKKLMEG